MAETAALVRLSVGSVAAADGSFEVALGWRQILYREGQRKLRIGADHREDGTREVYLREIETGPDGRARDRAEADRIKSRVRLALGRLSARFVEV